MNNKKIFYHEFNFTNYKNMYYKRDINLIPHF